LPEYPIESKHWLFLKHQISAMSDNFFEGSTAAVGTIVTIALIGIIVSILIWG
jgi:hypothetical protein